MASKITSRMPAAVASSYIAAAEASAAAAPKSVLSIPTVARYGPIPLSELADPKTGRTPGATIQQLGSNRRVTLYSPHLTRDEMDGLAYRIRVIGKSTNLSSILLTNNVEADGIDATLPTSALETEKESGIGYARLSIEDAISAGSDEPYYVAAGYDARSLSKLSKEHKNKMLNGLGRLAKAVKGEKSASEYTTKIPFISVPHGLVTDGGYATSMGSYVLATTDTRFRIMNPLRGLSLDPIGFSYILPRLGWEFNQPSANYPVGSVLALTGYEADGRDMVETGLATHFIGSFRKVGTLERALAETDAYENQKLLKEPIKMYGEARNDNNLPGMGGNDINARFRNVSVARLLFNVCSFDAMGQDFSNAQDEREHLRHEDPSLVLEADRAQMLEDRESMLLNIAATFQDVFEKEKSVEGIIERMKEYAAAPATNADETEFVNAAKEIVEGMEAQSPLALIATHRLLKVGKERNESLETCVLREKKVQLKLLSKQDFNMWAESGAKEGDFNDWMHKSVKDVTNDEVEELFK